MAAKNDKDGRDKALDAALAQIEKHFGQGAIMRMSDNASMNVEAISTGSFSLDVATGIGGLPRGRIIEIYGPESSGKTTLALKGRIIEVYGPESSGKTTLALHVIAESQKLGGRAAFIDAEHALDPVYAKNLGVVIEDLLVSQPDTGEQALEICDMLASSGAIDVIVIDSVAALVPKAEIQGEMGDSHVGLQARLMSQALRKLTGTVNKTNTCVIFINQLREKVGVMFGNPEVTTGGRALKFYSSMRFDVRKIETIKQGEQILGSRTRVKVVKNKVAPPFKNAEFDIMYGKGISLSGDILDCAVTAGIVKKSGSWYSYGGDRIGQGREAVKAYLEDNPELMNKIRSELMESLRPKDAEKEEEPVKADVPGVFEEASTDTVTVDDDGVIIE